MNKNADAILLVEDNPQDEMLTLRALRKAHVANRIDVARDGQQALDYLFRAGEFADRDGPDLPTVVRTIEQRMTGWATRGNDGGVFTPGG